MTGVVTASRIVELLRGLNGELAPDAQAIIRTRRDERLVDWTSFPHRPSCDLPGLPVGQTRDFRYSTDAADGLHAHVFDDGRVEFHLDLVDGCGNPVAHGLQETEIVKGTLIGLAVAGFIAIIAKNPRAALSLLGVGGTAGAAIGARVPRRTPVVYPLAELLRSR